MIPQFVLLSDKHATICTAHQKEGKKYVCHERKFNLTLVKFT